MLYVAAILACEQLTTGKVTMVVTVVGAILVGAYFAAIRQNLPQRRS
jgi:hypothetical protein